MRISSVLFGAAALAAAVIPAAAQAQYYGGDHYSHQTRGYGYGDQYRGDRHNWRARERWERRRAAEARRHRHHHYHDYDQRGGHYR